MATKTVKIEPIEAIGGGCRATCESYYNGTKPGSSHYDGMTYTNYQCVATVGAGWRFVRFEYVLKGTTTRGLTYTDTVKLKTNPAPPQKVTTNWANPFEYDVQGADG